MRTGLLALAGLPFLLLVAALAFDSLRRLDNDVEEATRVSQRTAERVAAQAAEFLASSRQILAELERRPLVRAMDRANCDPLLDDLRRLQPSYANALTLDAAGMLVCSGVQPRAGAAPNPDPKYYLDEVRRTLRFTVGKPARGFATGRWVSTLALPVVEAEGRLRGVIGLTIDLASFEAVVSTPKPPPGMVVAIVNGEGTTIALSGGSADRSGGAEPAAAVREIVQRRSGSARLAGFGGAERYFSFTPIAGSDWIALAGIDAEVVLAPVKRATVLRLLLLALTLGGLAALMLFMKRRLQQPLEALAETVRAVRGGDLARRAAPRGAREIAEIAAELNALLDARVGLDAERRESDRRFSEMLENVDLASVMLDAEGRLTYANDYFLRLTGWAREEVLGRDWFDTFVAENREARRARYRQGIAEGKAPQHDDTELVGREGRRLRFHWTLTLLRDAAGRPSGNAAIGEDITDREAAYAALRQREERYRALAEQSPDAILIHQDMRIVFANRAFVELMRAPDAAALIGRSSTSVIRPEFEALARERIAALYAGKSLPRSEQVYVRLDGSTVPVEIAAAPIVFEGRPAAQVTVRDITDRVRERALVVGQSRIMERMAAGATLAGTLQAIVEFIEADAPDMLASILLLDEDGVHVRHGAAARLPAEYVRAVDGQPIGPQAGSCGTAMHRREQVVVADIATDPLWEPYRELAAAHGLRACWSTPIIDAQRRVLGSFALYFHAPGRPNERDQQLIRMATHTAAIAIAKSRDERALADREAMFRSTFEGAPIGMTLTDASGRLMRCNPTFARMLGYEQHELEGRPFAQITHPDDVAENARLYGELIAGRIHHFRMEKRYLRKDGGTVWVYLNVSRMPAASAGGPLTIGMMEDITERRLAQDALRRSEARYRGILENMTDGFLAIDREFRITYVNPRGTVITARSAESLVGRGLFEAFPEAVGTPFEADYRKAMDGRVAVQSEHLFEPWQRWFEVRAEPTPDGISVFFRDTTERKKSESRIEYLATHDGLTGLPNSHLIRDRITQAMAHARRAERQIAVIYLDLDRFKVINDGYGHPFGDAVLKAVGERLAAAVRDDDTVARLSGDEFLILLADLRRPTDMQIVVQKLQEAFERPFVLEGRDIHLSTSLGVSLFPQDGDSADALIGNADVAMYRAKELGRNNFQFFTRELSEETHRRVEIETELRAALGRGELRLVYQPKVALATGAINGAEALLRWDHPRLGAVSPSRFVPIAEDSGLIVPIGDWVLRTACAQARAWLDAGRAGRAGFSVSVNLSARQFLQQDVVAWVARVLAETRLPAAALELELTESMIAQDADKAIVTVRQLKDLGVRLAIDDFGTGYSNLSHLKRFRVDTLKIDQSFVRHLDREVDDATIVLTVIDLAHNLRMTAVAEGVETESQWRFLRLNRCDAIQGYYFSKPVPPEEMGAMLAEGRKLHNTVKP